VAKHPSGRDPVLLATVLNALVHHGAGVDVSDAMGHLTLIDSGDDGWQESELWLLERIDRITAELNADASR